MLVKHVSTDKTLSLVVFDLRAFESWAWSLVQGPQPGGSVAVSHFVLFLLLDCQVRCSQYRIVMKWQTWHNWVKAVLSAGGWCVWTPRDFIERLLQTGGSCSDLISPYSASCTEAFVYPTSPESTLFLDSDYLSPSTPQLINSCFCFRTQFRYYP